jgi:hypothetical protein
VHTVPGLSRLIAAFRCAHWCSGFFGDLMVLIRDEGGPFDLPLERTVRDLFQFAFDEDPAAPKRLRPSGK